MPKHLSLFLAFIALLVALFYHPIPNPEVWDADSRHIQLPDYSLPEQPTTIKSMASWPEKLETSYKKHQQIEVLSSIH